MSSLVGPPVHPRPRSRRWAWVFVIGAAAGLWFGYRPAPVLVAPPSPLPAERPSAPPPAAAQKVSPPRTGAAPQIHVVMINGGGSPEQNFRSHLQHLESMLTRLTAAGIALPQFTVFSGDGADPAPDLAVREESPPEAWRLDGTPFEATVRRHGGIADSRLSQAKLYPATRVALSIWFLTASSQMLPGDTLLLYVTDHGTRGSAADGGNRITLWGSGESLSVHDLRGLLEGLDPQVSVVMVMSQCFSGGFAALTDLQVSAQRPPGSVCGFFSSPADRPAYGCYAEDRGRDGVGHTFALLRALTTESHLGAAHDTVLLVDRTPDVPLRTSDIYLEERLSRAARAGQQDVEAFADGLLADAPGDVARYGASLARVDRLARTFGLPPTNRTADLRLLSGRLLDMAGEAKRRVPARQEALSSANRATLARFVAAHPDWRTRVDPGALGSLGLTERYALATELLALIKGEGALDPGLEIQLEALARARDDSRELAHRMEVRAAAVLRIRNQLFALAGQMQIDRARAGSAAERAELEELRRCEALELPLGTLAPPIGEPEDPPLPPLADDIAALGGDFARWASQPAAVPATAPANSAAPPAALAVSPYRGSVPASISDGRARLLFFWATWCGPCKAALPQLLAFSRRYDVPILAISDESREVLDAFFAHFAAPFPEAVAIDTERRTAERFSVSGLPAFVLLDGAGNVAARLTGNSQGFGARLAAALPGT